MNAEEVLRMNEGEGDTSYARNSTHQANVSQVVKPIIDKAILDLYTTTLPQSLGIADLGCSSGSNSFSLISGVIGVVYQASQELQQHPPPEFRIFVNDLPGCDFNSVFKALPNFHGRVIEENGGEFAGGCFVAGVPGSFYGRLFPRKSLHFVHSSYCLHWLSQAPSGLESEDGLPLNKGGICISKRSPPCVWKAYLEQFRKDFSLFLKSRSEEIVDEGCMVLTLMARRSLDPTSIDDDTLWGLIGAALNDMVSQGLVEKEKIDSFNVPFYAPSLEEVESEIQREGSFAIETLETFETRFLESINNDDNRERASLDTMGERAAKGIRAVSESLIASHFGEAIINYLFQRLGEIIDGLISGEGANYANEKNNISSMVISLRKRG